MRRVLDVIGHGAIADALRAALPGRVGTADLVVHVPDVPHRQHLSDVDDAAWDAQCEALLRSALATCRRAHTALRERGGRIVLVTPTAGLVGEAGYVPFTAAVEGMRALAKSAARQWGEGGITVNCVAPPLSLFGVDVAANVDPPALGRPASVADLVDAVTWLAGAGSITGQTLVVDGGIVMAP